MDWSIDVSELNNSHINVKETGVVVAAVYHWTSSWSGQSIIIPKGSTSSKALINKGRGKDAQAMSFLPGTF